jgi:hypothetical protein
MIDSQPTSKNRNLLNRKTMSGPIDSNDSFSWFRKTVTMALMCLLIPVECKTADLGQAQRRQPGSLARRRACPHADGHPINRIEELLP